MGFLHRVAFGAELDHHHISFLELEGSALGINCSFDFGVVGGNPFFHLLMYFHEVGGIVDGIIRVGFR